MDSCINISKRLCIRDLKGTITKRLKYSFKVVVQICISDGVLNIKKLPINYGVSPVSVILITSLINYLIHSCSPFMSVSNKTQVLFVYYDVLNTTQMILIYRLIKQY